MKRVLIGSSSPIGYSYINSQRDHSKPLPFLYGSMGLFLLYDEIWFATRDLCPSAMQTLPYAKFLDEELQAGALGVDFDDQLELLTEAIEGADPTPGLGDWPQLMDSYVGDHRQYLIDNHGRGLKFFGKSIANNFVARSIAADLLLVERFAHLNFGLAVNPNTESSIAAPFGSIDQSRHVIEMDNVNLASRLIRLNKTHDYISQNGPYHPSIEELRHDDLLVHFRKWLDDQDSRLSNAEIADIEADVDAKIAELQDKSIRKFVETKNLVQVPIQWFKSGVMESLAPGSSIIEKVLDIAKSNNKAGQWRFEAFIAISRLKMQKE
ncbi:hypothetical protein ACK9YZ_00690 [Rhizobium sp. ZK1]|uniref:hypothetical protein n=1 Tax=Rhizobium sp. ZK1 TaxID=3389872 RepID=UPI0039F7309E